MDKTLILLVKTSLIYFIILIVMKFMGKREIGQLSLFDFIVLLLIADVSVIAINTNKSINEFIFALVPVFTLALIQKTLAYLLLKIPSIRNAFDGKETIIIYDGVLDVKALKKERYNIDDLLPVLRLKNIKSLSEVRHLIIEPNGEISVFTYDSSINVYSNLNHSSSYGASKHSYQYNSYNKPNIISSIFPVITSGIIHEEILNKEKLSKDWLMKEIKRNGYLSEKEILYATVEEGKLFILKTKQEEE